MRRSYKHEIAAKLISSIVITAICIPLSVWLIKGLKRDLKADKVTAGTVVSKDINNPYNGLFTSHGTQYYIVIDTGIEQSPVGKILYGDGNSTKRFSVDEDVYLSYSVGEYFDSYNYKKEGGDVKEEEQE